MANPVTLLFYQIYFNDPVQGAAAVAANGGSSQVEQNPEAALLIAPGGVILQGGLPFFSSVPGFVQLQTISLPITPASSGVLRTPSTVLTSADRTTVHEVTYFAGVVQTDIQMDYLWTGLINFTHTAITPTVDPDSGAVPSGKFELQVVTWIGAGRTNALIPTTFPLDSGTVVIWACGGANNLGSTQVNFFRHNQGMGGTAIMGLTTAPITTAGIMGFEAGGFRVTDGSFVADFGDTNLVPYVAVVMRDTTSDRRYLRCAGYKNLAGGNFGANAVNGSSDIFRVSGSGWTPDLDDLIVQDGAGAFYTFHYVSATQATICAGIHPLLCGPYHGVSGLTGFAFVTESPHDVNVQTNVVAHPFRSFQPTHVWVWGSTVAYKSIEFPGLFAVTLAGGASGSAPVNDMLTALLSTGFRVQDAVLNGSVWVVNVRYDYLALRADALFLAQHFFFSQTGTGSGPPTVVSGIPFMPGLIFGRQGGASFTSAAIFRGPHHLGTDSTRCSNIGGTNNVISDGISAIGATSADFGVLPAPVGDPYYGWEFPQTGTYTLELFPTYTIGAPPQPNACVAPFLGGPGSAPCAASTPVFP